MVSTSISFSENKTTETNVDITEKSVSTKATPLLLTVAVIELSDIAFAVDSIPAVLGVTRDPFIVLTSNLFAILGLRSLYVLISQSISELELFAACHQHCFGVYWEQNDLGFLWIPCVN
ncbi:hypothetical protein NE237_003358 [Protea cynaroides]|uniref:Uncharacterized protein n=1 Tax=Protea cynaroides TaxID=273540 RepID=A0A9Q0QSM8_9MAGN|nr:hypothetical protein NE237_003358 [Protea cynaroides]